MNTVILLVALANGEPSIYEGTYVIRLDPYPWPRGTLYSTPDLAKASRFSDADAATSYWQQEHGVRADGKPNRPLTAWTVEILDVPVGEPA